MENNICKFVSTKRHDEGINIINFVFEKNADFDKEYLITSTYSLALVTGGEGALHTHAGNFHLCRGALFVTLPAKPYYIENLGGLEYIYVSYTGLRAPALTERLGISSSRPAFYGFEHLAGMWESALTASDDKNADIFCEGLILYTFAFLCRQTDEGAPAGKPEGLLLAKEYVDMHYTDSTLNLKSVSERFSYDAKYFSAAFKKMVRIGFSDYLKNKRLSYALSLMESGVTATGDLCELCGYKDPLYFSKCFKKMYGLTPKRYFAEKIQQG